MKLQLAPGKEQVALSTSPYDRWLSPDGVCQAEFHRHDGGFVIRFPRQADFVLTHPGEGEAFAITAQPTPEASAEQIETLFHNAIQPLLGNHNGGLYLHGSAVQLQAEAGPAAIAFLGLSRSGKTTLAGAFAKSGHPFLTEDVIDLRLESAAYLLKPKRSQLRLFQDSAEHLFAENLQGGKTPGSDHVGKQGYGAGDTLLFSPNAAPLRRIFLLGNDHTAPLSLRRLSPHEALTALMPHSFILDVEDKPRLRGHFTRIGDLAEAVECYALDYPRDYQELPRVISAILTNATS